MIQKGNQEGGGYGLFLLVLAAQTTAIMKTTYVMKGILMLEPVSYQNAFSIDIGETDSITLELSGAFVTAWPLVAKYITTEILEGRITLPGRYVVYVETNGNYKWVKVSNHIQEIF